ncbi:MAG TPA: DNA-processing protein DprA [Syntrophales bacterium]|nr:DNA-processing protein DprA [Syntrophales bacterium]
MSIWSVIGSRHLPSSWESWVDAVVGLLLSRGHRICSGGAVGADFFVLRSLVSRGSSACQGSSVFLPGDLSLVPAPCALWLDRFLGLGGQVIEGSASESSARRDYVRALLIRNCSIVRASAGVVAFVSGCSEGSWFTVFQAVRRGRPVVVFPVDVRECLRQFSAGHWLPCRCLAGAYVFTYFKKD